MSLWSEGSSFCCTTLCRGFETEEDKASVLLNTAVYGDVTIVVYHARAAFGGKVQGKVCCGIITVTMPNYI